MRNKQSSITHLRLSRTRENKIKRGEPIILELSFKIDGKIREVFNPQMWQTAYDNHDKLFRVSIAVVLKLKRTKVFLTRIIRKASMFWTRSPKISSRIWILIIKDDTTFYPATAEEAKSLLFDVNESIELNTNNFESGNHKIYAHIKVSWGRHFYIEPTEITVVSNIIDFHIV